MNKRNYQKELDKKLEELQKGEKMPTLFLSQLLRALQQLRFGVPFQIF